MSLTPAPATGSQTAPKGHGPLASNPQRAGESRVAWMKRVLSQKGLSAASLPSAADTAIGAQPQASTRTKSRRRYGGARSIRLPDGTAPSPAIAVTNDTVKEIAGAVDDRRLNMPAPTTAADSRGSYNGTRRPKPLRHEDTPIGGKGYLFDTVTVMSNAKHGDSMQEIWGPSWPRKLYDLLIPETERTKFRTGRDREQMLIRRLNAASKFVRAAVEIARGKSTKDPVIIRRAILISELLTSVLRGPKQVEEFVGQFKTAINEIDGGYDSHMALVAIWKTIPKETFTPEGDSELTTRMRPHTLLPVALKAYRAYYKIED